MPKRLETEAFCQSRKARDEQDGLTEVLLAPQEQIISGKGFT